MDMPANLDALMNPAAEVRQVDAIPAIRDAAIRDAALAAGARVCLVIRSKEIVADTERNATSLDKTFNFGYLVEGNVLPPVVSEERERVVSGGGKVLRTADKVYRIERDAQLVTVIPTWRNYLYVGLSSAPAVTAPPAALIPKNDAERAVWRQSADIGCKAGREQADTAYQANIAKLTFEYEGMLRFKTMISRNMAVAPVVAKSGVAVSGNGREMALNDETTRIMDDGALQPGADWTSGGKQGVFTSYKQRVAR